MMTEKQKYKYTNNINKRIWRTIRKQNLLSPDDKIIVALSGGKDSMILLEALAGLVRKLPFTVELVAVHIYIKNIGYETDIEYLKDFCNAINVKFISHDFEIEMDPDSNKKECFICSWNRRKALFKLTKEMQCNKLAFGHHMDDAIETLFMNMIYHGSISSMPFTFKMFEGRLEVIRPLLEMSEEELITYATIKEYKKEVKHCPYETTKRLEIKQYINTLGELYKPARKNILRSMNNIYSEYLPEWKE